MTERNQHHLIDTYQPDHGPVVKCYVSPAGYFMATFPTASGDDVERSAQTLAGLKEAIDKAVKIMRPKVDMVGTMIDPRNGNWGTAILRGIHGGTGAPRVEQGGTAVKWDESRGYQRTGVDWHKQDVVFVPEHVDADLTAELVARVQAAQVAAKAAADATAHFHELAKLFSRRLNSYRTYGRTDLTEIVKAEADLVKAIEEIPATVEAAEAEAVAAE